MLRTPEQSEKMAQAFYKAAQDKTLPPMKRLDARIQAKRWRGLANWAGRKQESEERPL
jgi:hypothetical protein